MAEIDPEFAPFLVKWRARVRMEGTDAPEAYMRAEKAKLDPVMEITQELGKTGVYVEVDGSGLAVSLNPGVLRGMVNEWQAVLKEIGTVHPRVFTKQVIVSIFAYVAEMGPAWSEVISGAVWLASSNIEGFAVMERGDVTLVTKFTFDDEARQTRMQMELLIPRAE